MRKKTKGNLALFTFGGLGYLMIEFLWRGRSHWTMGIAGGVCFTALYRIYKKYTRLRLINGCLAGAAIITFVELCFGVILNKRLRLNVWDYSNCRHNLKGLICPLYSALWALICVPIYCFCRAASK